MSISIPESLARTIVSSATRTRSIRPCMAGVALFGFASLVTAKCTLVVSAASDGAAPPSPRPSSGDTISGPRSRGSTARISPPSSPRRTSQRCREPRRAPAELEVEQGLDAVPFPADRRRRQGWRNPVGEGAVADHVDAVDEPARGRLDRQGPRFAGADARPSRRRRARRGGGCWRPSGRWCDAPASPTRSRRGRGAPRRRPSGRVRRSRGSRCGGRCCRRRRRRGRTAGRAPSSSGRSPVPWSGDRAGRFPTSRRSRASRPSRRRARARDRSSPSLSRARRAGSRCGAGRRRRGRRSAARAQP